MTRLTVEQQKAFREIERQAYVLYHGEEPPKYLIPRVCDICGGTGKDSTGLIRCSCRADQPLLDGR